MTWMGSNSPGQDKLLLADSDLRKAMTSEDDQDFQDYLSPQSYFNAEGHRTTGGKPLTSQAGHDATSIDPFSTMEYDEQSFEQPVSGEPPNSPTIRQLESIISSLITQDLLHGYLMHRNPRFVIPGARKMGALPTGFPPVWRTIYNRERQDRHVPGWVRAAEPSSGALPAGGPNPGIGGGGRVVNLSNARPVGSPG